MVLDQRFVRAIRIDPPRERAGYPFAIPAVSGFGEVELAPSITYLIGENGSGKSTILEALAICLGLNAEGGSRNTRFDTFATESILHRSMTVIKGGRRIDHCFFFRAETMYNLFSAAERQKEVEFGWHAYGWADRHDASHGEGHLQLIRDKLGTGFYIFDEPEAALSPTRQLSLLTLFHDLVRAGSQLVISTHSPILLAYPSATIFSLDGKHPMKIGYNDASCVQTMDLFMRHRDAMVQELTED